MSHDHHEITPNPDYDGPGQHCLPPEVKEGLAKDIPNPSRLGDVSEFSALAQHIVNNHYINGETIRLDAALRM